MKAPYHLLSCLLAASVGFGQTSAQAIQLHIAADPAASAGSPVYVTITLTNNTRDDIDASTVVYKMNNEYSMYSFDVRDANNDLVLRRDYPHLELSSASAYNRTLRARESLEDIIAVNRIYNMTKLGIYAIRVNSVLPKELGGMVVLSNSIKVTINPDTTIVQPQVP